MDNITVLKDIMDKNNTQFHSYSDYSVTGIIDTPKVTILRKRHPNKPTVKSQIASFYGTANHDRMEKMLRLLPEKYAVERTITLPFTLEDGTVLTLSGKYDALELETRFLWDLKTCNTWKTIFDPEMEDWHKQQNIYKLMCTKVGEDIKGLRILAWYKDWKKNNALRDKTYPQNQIVEYELKMWSYDDTLKFLMERLELMHAMNQLKDDDIPPCSREDRWERHPNGDTVQYALMKNPKAARALRCKSSMKEIIEYARTSKALTSESFIEVRYAQPTRCVDYCGVNYVCDWYKKFSAKKGVEALFEMIPISEVM